MGYNSTFAYVPQRAAVLCRISEDRSGDGHGVDDQESYLVPWGRDTLRWKIARVVKENSTSASARTRKVPDPALGYVMRTNRPKFQRLLRDLRSVEIDGLIVRDIDRTIRDGRDLQDLIDTIEASSPRIPVVAQKGDLQLGNKSEIMMTRMFAAVAIRESEKIAERVRDTKKLRAAEGKYRGGPRPYGFEKDGVTLREGEAGIIRKAADAFLAGGSLTGICRDLNNDGVPLTGKSNRRTAGRNIDRRWGVTGLRQILLRARNAGLIENTTKRVVDGRTVSETEIVGRAEWYDNAILPEDKWRALCAKLRDEDRRTSPGPAVRHLGTHLYFCGICQEEGIDTKMVINGGTTKKPGYLCPRKLHLRRNEAAVDAIVVAAVTKYLADPASARLLRKLGPEVFNLSIMARVQERDDTDSRGER